MMNRLELTPEELKLVQLYAQMQPGIKPRWPIWLVEIGAPLSLAVLGLVTQEPAFFGAAIGGLIVMNANRMFRQFKYVHQLKSICSKVVAHLVAQQENS